MPENGKVFLRGELKLEGVDQPVEVRFYPREEDGKENDFRVGARTSEPLPNGHVYILNGTFSTVKKQKTKSGRTLTDWASFTTKNSESVSM